MPGFTETRPPGPPSDRKANDRTMNIDHINISAPKDLLKEVRDFYCEVLGLREGFRPNLSRPGFWLYAGDNALIHLVESNSHYASERPGYLDHFALRSAGLQETLERLQSRNIDHRTSFIAELGLTQVFCKDPAGTGVEIGFPGETV